MYSLTFSKQATKYLRKIHINGARAIRFRLRQIADSDGKNVEGPDIKRLRGQPGYRLRYREWRVIYHLDSVQRRMIVIKIGPRGDIYK